MFKICHSISKHGKIDERSHHMKKTNVKSGTYQIKIKRCNLLTVMATIHNAQELLEVDVSEKVAEFMRIWGENKS